VLSGLPSPSAEYRGGISFSDGFCRLAVIFGTVGFILFMVCVSFISYYIWVRARASIRSIFFRVLSFNLTIVKMTLSEFRPLEALRDLCY
jgi:hypothetical protein